MCVDSDGRPGLSVGGEVADARSLEAISHIGFVGRGFSRDIKTPRKSGL
jgi:hypothetical protein